MTPFTGRILKPIVLASDRLTAGVRHPDGRACGRRRRPVRTAGRRQRQRRCRRIWRPPPRAPARTSTRPPPSNRCGTVDVGALGLGTPGVLTVGTLSDAPPSICINSQGQFTGFDNELLRAIADKLGLRINFVGTDFSGLLAQVASRRFDVGSSSITTTDARRRTVGFTNGYDFGYFSLVVPTGSAITGFDKLAAGQRIGVVQGTVQEAYVVDTLDLDPGEVPRLQHRVRQPQDPPDRRLGGAVAAGAGHRAAGDPAEIIENTFSLDNFVAYAVAKENQAADRRAELRAGRGDRRRHLVAAVLRLGAARAAAGLEAGSKAAPRRSCRTSRRSPPATSRRRPRVHLRRNRNRRCRNWPTRSSTGTCTSRRSPTCSRPACRTP